MANRPLSPLPPTPPPGAPRYPYVPIPYYAPPAPSATSRYSVRRFWGNNLPTRSRPVPSPGPPRSPSAVPPSVQRTFLLRGFAPLPNAPGSGGHPPPPMGAPPHPTPVGGARASPLPTWAVPTAIVYRGYPEYRPPRSYPLASEDPADPPRRPNFPSWARSDYYARARERAENSWPDPPLGDPGYPGRHVRYPDADLEYGCPRTCPRLPPPPADVCRQAGSGLSGCCEPLVPHCGALDPGLWDPDWTGYWWPSTPTRGFLCFPNPYASSGGGCDAAENPYFQWSCCYGYQPRTPTWGTRSFPWQRRWTFSPTHMAPID